MKEREKNKRKKMKAKFPKHEYQTYRRFIENEMENVCLRIRLGKNGALLSVIFAESSCILNRIRAF